MERRITQNKFCQILFLSPVDGYGCFVYSKIDKYEHQNEDESWDGIIDPDSFLFSFKKGKPRIFELKEKYQNESVLFLPNKYHEQLFSMGNCEICVGKKGHLASCEQDEDSFFDYQGKKKALTGIEGKRYAGKQFKIKRLVVLQFK